MIDLTRAINSLRRPSLLIRAARLGVRDYRRERDLGRLVHAEELPNPASAVSTLLSEEQALESIRQAGDASYSPMRHVEVLIALIAEARLLPREV